MLNIQNYNSMLFYRLNKCVLKTIILYKNKTFNFDDTKLAFIWTLYYLECTEGIFHEYKKYATNAENILKKVKGNSRPISISSKKMPLDTYSNDSFFKLLTKEPQEFINCILMLFWKLTPLLFSATEDKLYESLIENFDAQNKDILSIKMSLHQGSPSALKANPFTIQTIYDLLQPSGYIAFIIEEYTYIHLTKLKLHVKGNSTETTDYFVASEKAIVTLNLIKDEILENKDYSSVNNKEKYFINDIDEVTRNHQHLKTLVLKMAPGPDRLDSYDKKAFIDIELQTQANEYIKSIERLTFSLYAFYHSISHTNEKMAVLKKRMEYIEDNTNKLEHNFHENSTTTKINIYNIFGELVNRFRQQNDKLQIKSETHLKIMEDIFSLLKIMLEKYISGQKGLNNSHFKYNSFELAIKISCDVFDENSLLEDNLEEKEEGKEEEKEEENEKGNKVAKDKHMEIIDDAKRKLNKLRLIASQIRDMNSF